MGQSPEGGDAAGAAATGSTSPYSLILVVFVSFVVRCSRPPLFGGIGAVAGGVVKVSHTECPTGNLADFFENGGRGWDVASTTSAFRKGGYGVAGRRQKISDNFSFATGFLACMRYTKKGVRGRLPRWVASKTHPPQWVGVGRAAACGGDGDAGGMRGKLRGGVRFSAFSATGRHRTEHPAKVGGRAASYDTTAARLAGRNRRCRKKLLRFAGGAGDT